jgi:RNA polymerase sigma factor (TIGR02999 family)
MTATSPTQPEITNLLARWSDGDRAALDKLFPLVFGELRRLAHRYMRREKPGHMLQTTALVNEAYLRLVDQRNVRWQNRAHFFAIASQMMRRILVDHARSRRYDKRGGGVLKISLEEAAVISMERARELVALDDALMALEKIDPRRSRVVEMRFFGGLDNDEIAEVLKIHPNTVTRDWNLARAWLHKEVMSDK